MNMAFLCAAASKAAYVKGPRRRLEHEFQVLAMDQSHHWRVKDEYGFSHEIDDYRYRAAAFANDETKTIIISHCGSDVIEDLGLDYELGVLQRLPSSYPSAQSFSQRVREANPDYTIIETGHSLGAIYAELNSQSYYRQYKTINRPDLIAQYCRAWTFDSPGSVDILENEGVEDINHELITTYLSAPNLVNTASRHIGKLYRLYIHHIDRHRDELTRAYDFAYQVAKQLLGLKGLGGPVIGVMSLVTTSAIAFLSETIKYTARLHSMDHIYDAFNARTQEPYLYNEVINWPTCGDYQQWLTDIENYDLAVWMEDRGRPLSANAQHYNLYCEHINRRLCNYDLGGFVLPATAPTHHEYADHARQALRIFDEFYTVDDARLKTELARALGLVEVSAPTGFINIGEETMPGNNAKLNNIIVGTTGVVGGATGATAGAISAAGGAATTGGVLAALKAAPVAAACGAAAGVVAGGFLFAGAAKLTINAVNYCFMDEIPAPAVRVAAPVAMPAPVPVALPAPAPVSLPAPVVAAESEAINGLVSSLREMHGLLNDIREERRERDVTAVPAIPASAAPAPAVPAPIPEVEALRLELADTRAASQRQAVEFSAMKEQLAQLMALLARNATNNAPQEADGADAATLPVPRAGGPALLLMSGRDDAIPEADGDELVA